MKLSKILKPTRWKLLFAVVLPIPVYYLVGYPLAYLSDVCVPINPGALPHIIGQPMPPPPPPVPPPCGLITYAVETMEKLAIFYFIVTLMFDMLLSYLLSCTAVVFYRKLFLTQEDIS